MTTVNDLERRNSPYSALYNRILSLPMSGTNRSFLQQYEYSSHSYEEDIWVAH